MTIFLPISFDEGIDRTNLDTTQRYVDQLVDQLLAEVARRTPKMVEVANEEGARKMTAAIFLLRGCELLKEILAADGDAMLQSLGLRSVFELAVVGRYLVAHPDGAHDVEPSSPTSAVEIPPPMLQNGAAPQADRCKGSRSGRSLTRSSDRTIHPAGAAVNTSRGYNLHRRPGSLRADWDPGPWRCSR